jgi:cytochrome c553
MKVLFRGAACLILMVSASAMAAGDAAQGEQKSAMCAACHGADGNSAMAMWPKLAGQHEAYLTRQVQLIRDGARPVPEMMGLVAGMSDQDIADISAFFARQQSSPAVADAALVSRGERLYRAGNAEMKIPACMSCHGPAGEGNPLSGYPALAGQHATYLAKMLNGFRDGTTWGEDDASSLVMAEVSKYLEDDEIEAVASYIQGLYSNNGE